MQVDIPQEATLMKIYITEYDRDNVRYEGPLIVAGSWAEAEAMAGNRGVILVGERQFVTDGDGVVIEAR
jgi:hypothetical protein